MLYFYSLLVWVAMVFLAIINGSFRNFIYQPYVGELVAHQISTFSFIILILLLTFIFLKILKQKLAAQKLFLIGGLWLLLTVIFEFGFGHYIMNKSWSILLADYNILQGRLWSLVLLLTFLAPYLADKIVKNKFMKQNINKKILKKWLPAIIIIAIILLVVLLFAVRPHALNIYVTLFPSQQLNQTVCGDLDLGDGVPCWGFRGVKNIGPGMCEFFGGNYTRQCGAWECVSGCFLND